MTDYVIGSEARPLRVAIVGSGPSAFYTADALFRVGGLCARVDMFERLPTPYGLVRGGVAPDHQKIKSVVKVYERIARNEGYRYFGNVTVGRDVSVEDLAQAYDQIVYAIGNESDRWLGVPGEDLEGVRSATEFVGWYNGHPDFQDRRFDLRGVRRIAVVGNGNVAMDVTRILMRDSEELAPTDIADYALEELRRSDAEAVELLGRRGPAQAAFSPKEIEEVAELRGVDLTVDPADVELDEVSRRWLEKAPRSARHNVEFLAERARRGAGSAPRRVQCHFLVSPVEILGQDGRVAGVRCEKNELYEDDRGVPRPRGVGVFVEFEADLVLEAIGYRGVPIPGVPFDERRGTVLNENGRVLDPETGKPLPRHYVVGWAKRGPTGLIGTNSPDAKATVECMIEDLRGKRGPALPDDFLEETPRRLSAKGIDFVTFDDWKILDEYEIEEGRKCGKVRCKVTTVSAMLEVIHAGRRVAGR